MLYEMIDGTFLMGGEVIGGDTSSLIHMPGAGGHHI
jgi:hypothetical protein